MQERRHLIAAWILIVLASLAMVVPHYLVQDGSGADPSPIEAIDAPTPEELAHDPVAQAFGFVVLVMGAGALAALIWWVRAWVQGRLQARHRPPPDAAPAFASAFGGCLLGFTIIPAVLVPWLDLESAWALWVQWALLIVLPAAWWWLRGHGHSVSELRQAVGLARGAGWWREVGAGLIGWMAFLPVVFVLLLVMVELVPPESWQRARHPITDSLLSGDAFRLVTVILLAVVWAPLMEELLFRGLLLHHLRGGTSALFACSVQGFLFAAVHPQGLLLIPPLTLLGAWLGWLRLWRGSLIAPMVMHAVHNGAVLAMVLVQTRLLGA